MSPPSASTFKTSTTRNPRRAQNRSMVVTGITSSPARGASAAAVPLVALVLLLMALVVGGGTKVSRPLSSFFLEKKPVVVSLGTAAVSAALRYSNVGRTNDAGYGAVTWAVWWCCVVFGRRCGKRW